MVKDVNENQCQVSGEFGPLKTENDICRLSSEGRNYLMREGALEEKTR